MPNPASCLIVALALAMVDLHGEGFTFPSQKRGNIEARLAVRVEDPAEDATTPVVRLTLTVDGPEGIEVISRLDDPTAAWQPATASSWLLDGDRVTWQTTYHLRQTKPGFVPVPAVKALMRASPGAPWQEMTWVDILKEPREGPEPTPAEPLPAAPPKPFVLAGAALTLIAIFAIIARLRRKPKPATRLPADRKALEEFERLTRSLALAPGADGGFHQELAEVLRRYLAERFSIAAPQQTTAEVLVAMVGRLTPEQGDALRDLLAHCDRARFTNSPGNKEESLGILARAQEFVKQTANDPSAKAGIEVSKTAG